MSDELHLVCKDCQELKYACRCGNGEEELENYRQKKVLKLCHEARELCKESPLAAPAGSALIGECDTCGNITAIDLDDTPERWKEMQYPGRTVKRLPSGEALKLWRERGKRCNHKALIAELRARVAQNTEPSPIGLNSTKP